jgi:phosphoglycolate phosphatase-like HAD superfamily hydrolase
MLIGNIGAIGFDWDGTLVDSMSVKSAAFAESVAKVYPNLTKVRKEVEALYLTSRGVPRTDQLALIQNKYTLTSLTSEETQKWSDLFTSLYIDRQILLFSDAVKTLDGLTAVGYKLFLCSSVPQKDLEKTITRYPLNGYFEVVLGSSDGGVFRKGAPHFNYISSKIGIPLHKMAFVGDSPEDVRVANEAGCFSIGKIDARITGSRNAIEKEAPNLVIENLQELINYFSRPSI